MCYWYQRKVKNGEDLHFSMELYKSAFIAQVLFLDGSVYTDSHFFQLASIRL